MPKSVRDDRLQIMLTKEELDALDSWRFAKRMPSRAAAIRELLKRGLGANGFDCASETLHSRQFGVIDSDASTSKSELLLGR